jgi:hypothetical protein
MSVPESALKPLTFLAEGGFAAVYRTPYLLPGDNTALAYKKFKLKLAEQAKAAGEAIAFRAGLPGRGRAELDEYAVWPRKPVVGPRGNVCGYLMPLIPPDFFCRKVDDKTGQMTSAPRNMYWLMSGARQRQAAKVNLRDVELTERLALLAKLTYIIGRLHHHELVFGDIHWENAVFALDPVRVLLVDCDGVARLDDPDREQASAMNWDPPECPLPGKQFLDDRADVYKLGLMILRVLAPGKGAASDRKAGRVAGMLDPAGQALIARAVADDPGTRPSARNLYGYLRHLVASRTAVPSIARARLLTPLLLRGQDARIEWQATGAAEMVISWGNARQLTVDPSLHPQGYAFRVDEAGPVTFQARNRHGTVSVDLGVLTIYELPSFDLTMALPRLDFPELGELRPVAVGGAVGASDPAFAGKLAAALRAETDRAAALLRDVVGQWQAWAP